ncbi:hypothetical protein KS4_25980 [Poriferisphaera corsica]|uniref:PEP-CTERM sorting domain-containing protein n=1 Tax=Poriferisphaera corsica TaxID=2528020 RepID=A0A517YWC5_9BACT|nr:hypothetical protein [Poriferisphaera corsica]QDU34528.1 hypothetical protein KS4_25980 [Poriferisphaera corsica]
MSKLSVLSTTLIVPALTLLSVNATQAATVSGSSFVSSLYISPENTGGTFERENYRTGFLGQTTTGDRNDGDIYQSNGIQNSFQDVGLNETFLLGTINYTNGEATIEGTTPDTIRNVIVTRLNGSYIQFQLDLNVQDGGPARLFIDPANPDVAQVLGSDTYSLTDNTVNPDFVYNFNGIDTTLQLVGLGRSFDNINESFETGTPGSSGSFNIYGQLIDYDQFLAAQNPEVTAIAVPTPSAAALGLLALAPVFLRRKQLG